MLRMRIVCVLFSLCTSLWAADHYVVPGLATGTHTGANCTNAYSGFGTSGGQVNPASLIRGDTYWLLAGSLSSTTWSTPVSGTTVITITAAISSSHGSAADCGGLYGQTAFAANSAITTSYWAINGQAWPAGCSGLSSCGVTGYNIYFHNTTDNQGEALLVGPGTNFTIQYVEMSGPHTIAQWSSNTGVSPPATNYGDDALVTPGGTVDTSNLYVGYSYLHDVGVDLVGSNNQTTASNTNGNTHTYDHDFFARDWYTCTDSATCNHSQGMSECVTGLVVRYSAFLDIVQDGVIDVNVSATCPIADWDIYGNTIEWDGNIPAIRQAMVGGLLGFFGQTIASGHHINVYNNTFAGVGGYQTGANVQASWICWSTGVGSTNSGTVNIYNNLFWQTGNSAGAGTASDVGCGTIPGTSNVDYSQGFCPGTGCTNGAGYSPTGAHSLNSNTGNPFVNWDGSSNFNVSLTADTSAGLSIAGWTSTPSGCTVGTNCLNIDPLGVTRGANGTIDRGAFQILGGTATAPSITLVAGTYTGPQQIGPITDANSGTKITCGTIDGTTPVTNGAGTTCTNGFALNDPSYYTMGPTGTPVTVKLTTGTSTLTDSTVTSATYTINGVGVISADAFGYQCQSNSVNCASFTFPLVAGTPPHFRVWDCASPFYSTVTAGTNCNWASIESVTAGTYVWTALDSWMDAIDAYRAIHPGFIAAYTFGMIPCTEATLPGGFTVTGVTATAGSGVSATTTYSGSFGTTTLLGMYLAISGMNNSSNNVSGVAAITTWSSSSITITGQAGVVDLSANTGTLNGVPGPKGCGIVPSDLPLSAGSPWNGTPPSPGPSPSFNAFVTALVNHCSAGHPTHCFYNEFNVVEGWNEPNNAIFCNPGFCSIPQIYQMLAGAIPIIRAKMTGAGGTNKVSIQTMASTASAAATNTVLSLESANGILSDTLAFHQYLSATGNTAPEADVANMLSIIGKRSLNVGWANTPPRITEWSWQSNNNPYGCNTANYTTADCIGQMVRWRLLAMSNGIVGLDEYNWKVNIGSVPAYQSAYAYQEQYLTGGTLNSPCTNAGSPPVYQCPFTEANGTIAQFVWTTSESNTSFTVPAGYTQYRDLSGNIISVVPGNSMTITIQPVMLEQGVINPPAPATGLFAIVSKNKIIGEMQ